MGGLLADLTVRYSADLSNLTSGLSQAKSDMSSVADVATQTTAAFKQMSGAGDLSKTVSSVDVAQAQLTLLESKVNEARAKLQTLQNSANAGEAVTGIPEAEAQLTILEAKAQEARTNLQELQTQEEETGEAASTGFNLGGAIGGIADFTSKIGMSVMGLQAMGQMAVQTASSLLQPAATAETTQLSFTTLLHSTSAAKDMMQQLNTFASSTPMQTQWIDDAASKMLAFGFKSKDVVPDITAIGDSLSGLGKLSDSSLSSIVDIFGKIQAQGKITGGDMMQLSDWGIPAWQALSQAMGKPIPELQKMVSSGLIPANTAIQALTTGMEKTFGGGMAKQANTLTGLMSTLASNWQIAMAAMGTPVLQALEPQLTKVVNLLSSPAFQQFATVVGQDIGAALGIMVSGFMQIITIASQVVAFFQQNQLAMDALVAVLIGAGVGILAFATAYIPVLITALGAWAIAQWAVLAPLLLTAAPFVAIGIVVAAVVFGIIVAVQNWGAIGQWLQGVWQATWDFLVNAFRVGGQLLFDVLFGPIVAIVDLFNWLYQHNTYFKELIDAIVGWVKSGIAWLQSAWSIGVAFVVTQWQRLVGFATSIWQQISAVFASIWNTYIGGPLGNLWNQLVAWFDNWGNMALQAGANLINMLVQGILSGVGDIWDAVTNVAQTIWQGLGFHSPAKAGPGKDADTWMPNLVNMLSAGLIAGVPKMQTAAFTAAQPLTSFSPSQSTTIVAAAGSNASGGGYGGEQHIHLDVDGLELAHIVNKATDKHVRLKLGSKGRLA